jgi:hypothetical protein
MPKTKLPTKIWIPKGVTLGVHSSNNATNGTTQQVTANIIKISIRKPLVRRAVHNRRKWVAKSKRDCWKDHPIKKPLMYPQAVCHRSHTTKRTTNSAAATKPTKVAFFVAECIFVNGSLKILAVQLFSLQTLNLYKVRQKLSGFDLFL